MNLIENEKIDELDFQKKSSEYFYDGIEEILSNSDNDDDERLFNDQHRISFTREQLLEYQQLTKLLRFIKNGGRCTTLLSLVLLQDHHLDNQCAYLAFKDTLTIHILINFIEMFDQDIKLNSFYILKDACQNQMFAYELFRLGGIITIIDSICLDLIGIEESCEILSKIILFRRARRVIRRSGSISKLISLLDELTENLNENYQKICQICQVFLLICKSEKNKYVCIRYGIGQIFLKILSTNNHISSISILSFLCLLLQISIFRDQMLNKDLIINLINSIDTKNVDLTRILCECLYYFSINSSHSQLIYENSFEKFENLLEETTDPSISSSIIDILSEFIDNNQLLSKKILLNLIRLIENFSSDLFYFSRLIKSLNQLTKFSQTIQLFKQENIFSKLIFYLENPLNNNFDVQLNILSIFQQSAKDSQSARMIVECNGLQIFWTLYKISSLPIQISAGWAIENCLASIENHGELVRSFDGIFYLLLNKLSTDNLDLLSVTLAIIAQIARDQYNLQILTDLGFLMKISQLKQLENVEISQSLCNAIANLLNLKKNQQLLSNRRVLLTLKNCFQQQNQELLRPLTKIIYDFSFIPSNCVILHEIDIDSNLLELIGNDDSFVQENAAKALRNMRKLIEINRNIQRNLIKKISRVSQQKPREKRTKCI